VSGLFLRGLAFALVFFGAFKATEYNFNGMLNTIALLPIHRAHAACAIGFSGSIMLASGLALKEHTQTTPSIVKTPARA
jgi:hypothetical protein